MKPRIWIAALALAAFAAPVGAQTLQSNTARTPLVATPPAQAAPAAPSVQRRPPADQTVITSDGAALPVFGANLFTGSFAGSRPGQSGDYIVQPGDQVQVSLYGAVTADSIQTVDGAGRLYITGIGPVSVIGVPASGLVGRIRDVVSLVYTDTVGVYAKVVQGGTMGVYVSGDVANPGRYTGGAGDSVLYFLDQAGGIAVDTGSFRDIRVLRNGQVSAQYDLYAFLLEGKLEPFSFRDGDVILVGPRGAMVGVSGDVRHPAAFEVHPGARDINAAELLELARPLTTATGAGASTVRSGARRAETFSLATLPQARFADGDHIQLRSDVYTEQISVSIDGDLRGPRVFTLPRGAQLSQVLSQLPLDQADVVQDYIHIERRSVAEAQKAALDRALSDLERAALTSSTQNAAQQATLIAAFAREARGAVPKGKVTVYSEGRFNDLTLEAGDVVVLPRPSDVVLVAGEVLSPGALAHSSKLRVKDYVGLAGGYSESANRKRFVLRRADGSALVVTGSARPRAGDEIMVIPSFGSSLEKFKSLTQIAFQIATTAAAIINVTD